MSESIPTGRPISRRAFIAAAGAAGAGFMLYSLLPGGERVALAEIPGGTLAPAEVPKFVTPLLVPPVMPRAGTIRRRGGKPVDYYEISMRQFAQQVLPPPLPATTVWGYGAVTSASRRGLLVHHAPSLTIETTWNRPVRIKWINDLVGPDGTCLPHLLPVDPTLHWANPPGGTAHRDSRPTFTGATPGPYTGPVPIVTHVHGAAGVGDESDGYAEAWYLPDGGGIPVEYATEGTWYDFFAGKAADGFGATWGPGYAVFQYPNDQRESTLWYHDHALGMTRLNVYAGPAGFFIVRGGPEGEKAVLDARTGTTAVLPGPAPIEGDRFPSNKTYFEIPLAIQDRSFDADGELFYPDTRAFFDGIVGDYLPAGDFSPIWQPEFFGNMLTVNGSTWPFHAVEQRRYRFRVLNGCQSRFLILDFGGIPGVEVWQIGNEGGFLAAPVNLTAAHGNRVLLGLAERADLVVDFTNVPVGSHVLANVGPDEPFGGGIPGDDFPVSDPDSTGQVMQFRVVPAAAPDPTTPPQFLVLPPITPLPAETATRPLALIEKMGEGVDAAGLPVEGPVEALLGDIQGGVWVERMWGEAVTENPQVGAVEVWEFVNATGDAHPMHVHEVAFEVVDREGLVLDGDEVAQPVQPDGNIRPPEPWETGFKDTVIAYPGEVTRVRARFDHPGQFVWHCHSRPRSPSPSRCPTSGRCPNPTRRSPRPSRRRSGSRRPTRAGPVSSRRGRTRSGRPIRSRATSPTTSGSRS
ncbi:MULTISPECIES: multicopper oxidase family protein [unclassified Agromyces]|uniref:multicopper oxidase family protein n=1 Tax=unclassified Agromyces TaxID=2639701 RepID=UPI0030155BD1